MDLRLFEDGSERGSALGSDVVVRNTASKGQDGNGERVGVSTALTLKQTLWGGGALELSDPRLLEDGGERGDALGSDVVDPNTASEGQDGNDERVGVSMGADTKANTLWAGGALDRPDTLVP